MFRSFAAAVPEVEVRARRLARLELSRPAVMADCTSPWSRAWGVTAEIHATPHYDETRTWADALARAGFDGIRYHLRHDPSQRLAGVALFGPAGEPLDTASWNPGRSGPIGAGLLDDVERRFGIRVRPTSAPTAP